MGLKREPVRKGSQRQTIDRSGFSSSPFFFFFFAKNQERNVRLGDSPSGLLKEEEEGLALNHISDSFPRQLRSRGPSSSHKLTQESGFRKVKKDKHDL